jgi:hypothetical protein
MNNPIYPFRGSRFYPIECALTNFNQQGINLFKDLSSNTLLNPNSNTKVKVVTRAIMIYYNSLLSTAPSGRPIITQANAVNLVCTFRVANDEPIYQKPYVDFATQLNYGIVTEIAPVSINFEKSEVICAGALPDGTTSALFGIWYDVLTYQQYDLLMKKMDEDKMKAIWR